METGEQKYNRYRERAGYTETVIWNDLTPEAKYFWNNLTDLEGLKSADEIAYDKYLEYARKLWDYDKLPAWDKLSEDAKAMFRTRNLIPSIKTKIRQILRDNQEVIKSTKDNPLNFSFKFEIEARNRLLIDLLTVLEKEL